MVSSTEGATPSQIIDALAPLHAEYRQVWATMCHAHGISILGFQLVGLLELHRELPMSRIADELDVALPNATGIVDRAEERGLVERHDDPADRRVVLVGLTAAGRRLVRDMEASRRKRLARLFAELDDAQRARLLQSARDLGAAARRLAKAHSGGEG